LEFDGEESHINNNKEVIKSLVLSFAKQNEPIYRRLSELLKKDGFPGDFAVFESQLLSILFEMQTVYQQALSMGMTLPKSDKKTDYVSSHNGGSFNNKNRDHKDQKHKMSHSTNGDKNKQSRNDSHKTDVCYGCGRPHHKKCDCTLSNHPDFNREKGG
jgi:hypothetical protein